MPQFSFTFTSYKFYSRGNVVYSQQKSCFVINRNTSISLNQNNSVVSNPQTNTWYSKLLQCASKKNPIHPKLNNFIKIDHARITLDDTGRILIV